MSSLKTESACLGGIEMEQGGYEMTVKDIPISNEKNLIALDLAMGRFSKEDYEYAERIARKVEEYANSNMLNIFILDEINELQSAALTELVLDDDNSKMEEGIKRLRIIEELTHDFIRPHAPRRN